MTYTQIPDSHVRSFLQRGLTAVRAGDYAEAHRCFGVVVNTDPDNITALLWLAWLVPSRRESLTLLCRVIKLDPENERAQVAMRWARRRPLSAEPVSKGAPDDERPVEESSPPASRIPPWTDLVPDDMRSAHVKENLGSAVATQRARRFIGPLGLLLIVAVSMLLIGVALIAWYSPSTVLAWMLPTATPGMPATSTLTYDAASILTAPTTSPPAAAQPRGPTPTAPPLPTATQASIFSPVALPTLPPPPPPTAPSALAPTSPPSVGGEKWIDVDLTHQRLTAYEGDTSVFETTISTGLPNTPTVVGQFRIYWKLTATTMTGPGYNLPGVPYTMYFHSGYALHGTYWHSSFGQPMSHGCVNLRTEDAEWLFNWADPPLPAGTRSVRSSNATPGTLVVVHH